jgi:hypothetical protein
VNSRVRQLAKPPVAAVQNPERSEGDERESAVLTESPDGDDWAVRRMYDRARVIGRGSTYRKHQDARCGCDHERSEGPAVSPSLPVSRLADQRLEILLLRPMRSGERPFFSLDRLVSGGQA